MDSTSNSIDQVPSAEVPGKTESQLRIRYLRL